MSILQTPERERVVAPESHCNNVSQRTVGESHLHEGSHGCNHAHETVPFVLIDKLVSNDRLTAANQSMVEENRLVASMDALGICASTLCLFHCLAMPFVIGALPLLGLKFLEGHAAHVVLAGFVLAFALSAVVPGYLKHRRKDILFMMLAGLSVVLYATFIAQYTVGESWEVPLISIGNLTLVATHLRNRALCRCSHKSL
jgi:hypothetical protein